MIGAWKEQKGWDSKVGDIRMSWDFSKVGVRRENCEFKRFKQEKLFQPCVDYFPRDIMVFHIYFSLPQGKNLIAKPLSLAFHRPRILEELADQKARCLHMFVLLPFVQHTFGTPWHTWFSRPSGREVTKSSNARSWFSGWSLSGRQSPPIRLVAAPTEMWAVGSSENEGISRSIGESMCFPHLSHLNWC